jgi:hypothetical protein
VTDLSREHDAMDEVLADIGNPPVHLWPLQLAIRTWISFVATVEYEFVGEPEDLSLELSTRDYLDELSGRLAGFWSDYIERQLAPWDERFKEATFEDPRLMLSPTEADGGWWHKRSPKRWTRDRETST